MKDKDLLQQYEPFIKNMAWRYIKYHPNDHDDIIQECQIAFMKSLATHDPDKGAIATHARWFIRSHMAEYLRKLKKQPKATVNIFDTNIPDPSQDIDATDTQYIRTHLSNAMAGLSERDKDIILSKYLMDQTLQEIGDRYGISRERVRQVLVRATERVRKRLKPALGELVG